MALLDNVLNRLLIVNVVAGSNSHTTCHVMTLVQVVVPTTDFFDISLLFSEV